VLWYIAVMCKTYYFDMESILVHEEKHNGTADHSVETLILESAQLLDISKKWLFYGKAGNSDEVKIRLITISRHVGRLAMHCNTTVEDCMQLNIDKLKARYPDKFDSVRAVHRNLDAENVILGKA